MSAEANVRSIQLLDELRGSLVRFSSETQDTLSSAAQEIQRVQQWLAERQSYWQREVRGRQDVLSNAQAALRGCQSQVSYDRDGRRQQPDCGALEAQVARARSSLAEGEAELRNVIHWARQVQQAVADYQRQAQRLASVLSSDLPKSTALLGRAVADLQMYQSVSLSSGGGVPGFGSAAQSQSSGASWNATGTLDEVAALHLALDRLIASAAGRPIAETIRSAGTDVRFGETDSGAIAHFDPAANEIVLNSELQGSSSSILAAHLAHEGTHVQWTGQIYSLDEEYHAFRNQAAAWNDLKGAESDPQCDWVSGIIALGETRAKWQIAELYPDLPDYG